MREPAPVAEVALSEEVARLWREAADPAGTPVEMYLERRGLTLPDGAAGNAIRFHPACKFGLERVLCMLALVRNIRSDEPQAIHRTTLDRAGNKIEVGGLDRMSLGSFGGGAVKLTVDPDVTSCLGIGEGIESALSLRRIPEFGPSPVWSVLSAGGIQAFPMLPGIECLWIAVDHDEAGQRSAATCAERWTAAGQEVFRVMPESSGDDLNDVTRSA
jgi:putative DNA primase/helicase